MRKPNEFERAYKAYLRAKALGLLTKSDKEPCGESYGLGEWEANQIKKRVDQGL